jgi:hypothetical protein
MSLPLPNLDDRRWFDLVEEGRAQIPIYAREAWTDHNAHDPGMTIVELFAWITEMNVYRVHRIPDRHKLKFLSLVGINPEPPCPAGTVLSFTLSGDDSVDLPAGLEFEGKNAFAQAVRFRTLHRLNVVPGRLVTVQLKDETGLYDLAERRSRDEAAGVFGTVPTLGAELYLGFSHPFPQDRWVNLYWSFAHIGCGENERRRLIEEVEARQNACRPPLADYGCTPGGGSASPMSDRDDMVPPHHSVRLVFEALVENGAGKTWRPLDARAHEIEDGTRALTLDGVLRIKLRHTMAHPNNQTGLSRDLYYLRIRFATGAYDTPPLLDAVVLNGVRAEQSVQVDTLRPGDDGAAKPVSSLPGTGAPHQRLRLAEAPVVAASLQIHTIEDHVQRAWEWRRDFDASKRDSLHFQLDPTDGTVTFGNGEKGRVPPFGAKINATYLTTLAEAGNLDAGMVYRLADSPRNRGLVKDFEGLSKRFPVIFKVTGKALGRLEAEGVPRTVLDRLQRMKDQPIQGDEDFLRVLESILGKESADRYQFAISKYARSQCKDSASDCITVTNPIPATGGSSGETLAHAIGRAIDLMDAPLRAVTVADYEALARMTPGVRLARVAARANLHPNFPCLKAPGMITLIILPDMPGSRPTPSLGLKRAVAAYLNRRRLIGTRVEVVGPTYVEVTVRAVVRASAGVDKGALNRRIVDALNGFFDPLHGGPDHGGWPFGRDVYRSEVLQVIDETVGVDHILDLGLFTQNCEPRCGNVCLAPTWLVASGQHQIRIQ